jgi:hypothetical protein
MHYRMEVRLSAADVGSRVVVRWRRPASAGAGSATGGSATGGSAGGGSAGGGDEIADVLGILEAADGASFQVRRDSGDLVTIPLDRALAGKPVPPKPVRSSPRQAPPER